ncbi:alpha-ketoglutarate-dependent dioxygenase AlkB [Nakamurella aerolata]|uniref:Alpha-ketoglutarate-dependent dioxygenase AlkB n=1 Tax=Nakamurella aerolata TaxID=1656892 RepID=A0A849AB54_9ACTN|nr:alpha-ketoglutarate-dependent dioxygenase AlkB [Nakamurella aerolata]NNG36371.1 alpha-ketoglutarate-dependent dioxygenase AlkB [Nakamurella aerolata]
MEVALQGSLFDQVSEVGLRPLGAAVRRRELTDGAWVDLRPGWLTGADELFHRLLPGGSGGVDWRAERREMYGREVPTPRLLRFYDAGERWPDPVLPQARDALSEHYAAELGEPFTTAGMCLYRDGRDSVAWHGDRIGRSRYRDTMVAIVSVGSPRILALRPAGGGASLRFTLGHGDLIVMGGSCQRTWEHAIPKTSAAIGPRISIQFRPHDVR